MKYHQNREIAYRAIEGQAVLFDTTQGMMRQLNPIGTELWQQMESERTIDDLVGWVLAHYEIDEPRARRDVEQFLSALVDRNLLITSST